MNYVRPRPIQVAGGVPLYARVIYRDLYPGIDLVFHDERGTLDRLGLAPGADPPRSGCTSMAREPLVQASGALVLPIGAGRIIQRAGSLQQDGDQSGGLRFLHRALTRIRYA